MPVGLAQAATSSSKFLPATMLGREDFYFAEHGYTLLEDMVVYAQTSAAGHEHTVLCCDAAVQLCYTAKPCCSFSLIGGARLAVAASHCPAAARDCLYSCMTWAISLCRPVSTKRLQEVKASHSTPKCCRAPCTPGLRSGVLWLSCVN